MSELQRRIIVALIAAPIALATIWFGDAPLATMLAAAAAIAAWEFYQLASHADAAPMTWLGVGLSAALPLVVHAQYLGVARVPPTMAVLAVLVVMAAALWLRGVDGHPLRSASSTVLGVLYTGGTMSFAYALRYFVYAVGDVAGALVLVLPVTLTWASDIGAYVAGRTIGGRKLMPSVSPGKTVSGAIGGVLLTVITCVVFVRVLLRPYAQLAFSPWGQVGFAVSVSVAAQVGDLVESLFKREAGVKDSGTIFPGHGGMLDRLDSMFFVLPIAYVLYGWLLLSAPA